MKASDRREFLKRSFDGVRIEVGWAEDGRCARVITADPDEAARAWQEALDLHTNVHIREATEPEARCGMCDGLSRFHICATCRPVVEDEFRWMALTSAAFRSVVDDSRSGSAARCRDEAHSWRAHEFGLDYAEQVRERIEATRRRRADEGRERARRG